MQNSEEIAHYKLLEISKWAVELHCNNAKKDKNKFRNGSLIPFFIHICEVTKKLSNYGFDFENKNIPTNTIFNVLSLGMCHDIYEDTTVTSKEIKDKVGSFLSDLIKMVTRPDNHESRKQKWDFLIDFANKESKHPLTVVVKIADRFCNVIDYHNHDQSYAAFYALQGFPLYMRFYESDEIKNMIGMNIFEMIKNDIDILDSIIKNRYNRSINEFSFKEAEKEVT